MTSPDADTESGRLESEASAVLSDTAERLERLLVELAGSLRPFPSFLGMVSVQAVELQPPFKPVTDLGCVVVNPQGEICRLEITSMEGIAGLTEADQVEEFQAVDLSPAEYIVYASSAIEVLAEELKKRSR